MSKHTTLPTVARVISDTYELPYAQAYAAALDNRATVGHHHQQVTRGTSVGD